MSTLLMAFGFFLMLSGCGVTCVLRAGPLPLMTGGGLGLAVLVVAAIVGQIGRAKQGRIL